LTSNKEDDDDDERLDELWFVQVFDNLHKTLLVFVVKNCLSVDEDVEFRESFLRVPSAPMKRLFRFLYSPHLGQPGRRFRYEQHGDYADDRKAATSQSGVLPAHVGSDQMGQEKTQSYGEADGGQEKPAIMGFGGLAHVNSGGGA
jgi:hypothetical protein